MNRLMQYFNFVGVMVLVVLCAVQWRNNSRLVDQNADLERTRQEQLAKLAEQDKNLKGALSDLDDSRQQFSKSTADLKDAQAKLSADAIERTQLTAQRDQLKSNLNQWIAAVAERDAALKKQDASFLKLQQDRNEAVSKFNDLVAKYDGLVKELNEARARLAAAH